MSQAISSAAPAIHHNNLNISTRERVFFDKSQQAEKAPKAHHHKYDKQKGVALKQAAEQFPSQHKIKDNRSLKAFADLSKSLEKALTGASSVDAQTGANEITEGGIRRIAKDLSKLFKGMGLDPHLAKQLSRGVARTMKQEGVEQIDLSVSITHSLNIEAYQVQESYTDNADGTGSTSTAMTGLQMSAVQTRSFDFSLNLSTGEHSLNFSHSDSFAVDAFDYQASQNERSDDITTKSDEAKGAAETTDAENGEAVTDNAAYVEGQSSGDISAFFMSRTSLVEISKQVQIAPIAQALEAKNDQVDTEKSESEEKTADAGLLQMQGLYDQLDQTTEQPANLFESLTQIRNLRIEQQQSVQYLRFSFDSFAPIGLAATNNEGYQTTLYPRFDGSLGVVEGAPVKVEA